ncbi:putative acyl-activating enzyme 19 isoform X3 [Nymphaea colorata]|uniref:putative acyl-activating enzyme 19 isoform X3 n=1 Tax=Nymphaea colorata TaxID=210225 RepID=UPI00214EA2AE|nr:putative acyl-activating enzyme 19 isoform X3 [Nymphaea colorata]
MAVDVSAEARPRCCISHLFHAVASSCPSKIAVVHAVDGAHVCRSLGERSAYEVDFDEKRLLSACRISQSPPIYPGDEYFTYGKILSTVEELSVRIRVVLDGGDDPALIKPSGGIDSEAGKFCSFDDSPLLVGIFLAPSVYYLVAVLATLRIGEAFLPIDPSWPKHRVLSIVSSSRPALVITHPFSVGSNVEENEVPRWLVSGSNLLVLFRSDIHISKWDDNLSKSRGIWPCQRERPSPFCYVMCTSGSTGNPKGVCGTEKGLLNRFLWMHTLFPIRLEDVLLFKTSISFIDHFQEVLGAILAPATLIIPFPNELSADPLSLIDLVKAYSVTRLIAVPSLIRIILPALNSLHGKLMQEGLKVLVLSGEVFPLSLWYTLQSLLPTTTILNLYGSTEVSGDCTFFDCKDLPKILETEVLSTVPIGKPIHGCKVILIGESNDSDDGEIFVGGACTSIGYLFNSASDFVYLRCHDESSHGILGQKDIDEMYFRTGDFARRLRSGDYVFMGRKDRLVKIHGQRISLEEVEDTLRDHPDVSDSAVTVNSSDGEQSHLIAYIILKGRADVIPEAPAASSDDGESNGFEQTASSLKHWLAERLPSGMIPAHFQFLNSFPVTSSGKIDYASLAVPGLSKKRQRIHISAGLHKRHLETVKKAFCRALMAEKVMEDDDFFSLGGNSMAAAYLGHILGIDMRLIYRFPSPSKILKVMLDQTLLPEDSFKLEIQSENLSSTLNTETPSPVSHDVLPESSRVGSRRVHSLESDLGDTVPVNEKKQPARICNSLELDEIVDGKLLIEDSAWISSIHLATSVSFSRCNKITFVEESELGVFPQISVEIDGMNIRKMQSLWKVNLNSCVDASPLVISMHGNVYLFIGAHSHFFVCVNALSGQLVWEVSLAGRVECSAAITEDFSQVIVGCYRGNVYFLDFMTGSIFWTFETGGEVKSQPVVDSSRSIVWCGSYDHNLYALDYKNHCCLSKIFCGGSIYGTPSIDMVRTILYVGSTSGRVTAVSLQGLPFHIKWQYESGAPIFASSSINPSNGNGNYRWSNICRSMHFFISLWAGVGVFTEWSCVLIWAGKWEVGLGISHWRSNYFFGVC